ncbi:hypothetical protein BKP42_61730 [Rhodococcus erythropolis]|uniref:Panacea domain-containing protein n=1 Tax=Rhodococcus erythropolis TaxID=1833 RepID=UPI000BB314F4|nr:Panacea domain-containing protein [Rhodococcus erythropolis]PBI87609.1 hypothetical protein BKP42_61730 [Rhodococcus erythropolis]
MSKLGDVLVYFCDKYPHKSELSKARLTKMVYLADWRSSIDHGVQITDLRWVFNHYGPYVVEVISEAERNPRLETADTQNFFGSSKTIVRRKVGTAPQTTLTDDERAVLNTVIRATEKLNYQDFIQLVYSTYPVVTQKRYQELDLPALAEIYNRGKASLIP